MTQVYFARTGTGSTLLPIADATFVVNGVSSEHPRGQVHVAFYQSDGSTLATPTAGTITPLGGLIAGQLLEPSTTTVINASEVQAGEADYTPSIFNGPVSHLQFTLAGIPAGAGDAAFVTIQYWGE